MSRNLPRVLSGSLLFALFILAVSCNNSNNETASPVSSDPKITALKLPVDFHADHLYSPRH